MKTTTRTITSIFTASTLVIAISAAAFAQSETSGQELMGGNGSGNHHGGAAMMMENSGAMHGKHGNMMKLKMHSNCGMMTQMHNNPEERLAELKQSLAITADQEDVWSAYVDAVYDKRSTMKSHRREMMNSKAIDPQPRFELHREGLKKMEKMLTTAENLYVALSPEQREQAGLLFGMQGNSMGRQSYQ